MQKSLMAFTAIVHILSNVTSLQCAYNFTSLNHNVQSVSIAYGDDRCLVFVSSKMAFDKAELICQENNGHLVDMDCTTESFIQGIFDKPTFSPSSAYWIGLRRYGGTWKWVNGDTTFHRNFDKSSWNILNSGTCIKMETSTMEWGRKDCDNKFPFICIIRNTTDSVAVHNKTEALTTKISPVIDVTTTRPNEPDPCVCNTTSTGGVNDSVTGTSNCSNHTVGTEHQGLQNTLDELMTKLIILIAVLGVSLLSNVITVIICLFRHRCRSQCHHFCGQSVQREKAEELEMAPVRQSPKNNHSVPNIFVHDPTVSCGSSQNELYSCVEDQNEDEVPEKVRSTSESNIYSTPEENENIYEYQLCRRVSETVMSDNSLYGEGSCQDLYEECDIHTDQDQQAFEKNGSIDSKKTKDLTVNGNRNCGDPNKCMSTSSKTVLHPKAYSNSYYNFSKQKMTNLEPVTSSDENIDETESENDLNDFNNDTIQPDIPKNESTATHPCCTYSDFNTTKPNPTEKVGENVYGIKSASDPLATMDENLKKDISNQLTSHKNGCGFESATIITNDGSACNFQNLQTETLNFNSMHPPQNTDFEGQITDNRKRKHYVNTEPDLASTTAFPSTSSTAHTHDDPQMPNQDIKVTENKDYRQANISELESDTLPPFQKTETEDLTKTDDGTFPLQKKTKEGGRLTGAFMLQSRINDVPESKEGYVLMDEKADDPPLVTQRSTVTCLPDELGLSSDLGSEGHSEKDPDTQVFENGRCVDDVEKQPDDGHVLSVNETNDEVQPEDDYALPLDSNCLSQSENGYVHALEANTVSPTEDDYELPLENNGDIYENEYSTPIACSKSRYVNISPQSHPPHTTEKSNESYTEPISSHQIVQETENAYSSLHENLLDALGDSKQNIYGLNSASRLSESINKTCRHTSVSGEDLSGPNDVYSNLNECRQELPADTPESIYGLESATHLTEPIDDSQQTI